MRSVVIVLAGLAILGFVLFAAWRFGGASAAIAAAKLFVAVWFVAALINMWIGVSRAGYSVMEELPIFLAIFLVPAAVAAFVAWKYA